jgi:hypothetical protein
MYSRTKGMVSKNAKIDGQNVLYHYFQNNILRNEDEFSKKLLERLLVDLSIWIPIDFYRKLPIILPYVVRDPSCRVKRGSGEDEWGAADSNGFLRDDNSLIKGIVRSFKVKSPKISAYDGFKLGTGFVASHIWGKVAVGNRSMISSRHYMLNSYVPNLVWLPVQISKLTDREGSLAQKLLQALSCRIYRGISMSNSISILWNILLCPKELQGFNVDLTKINYFLVPSGWLEKRVSRLVSEIDVILSTNKLSDSELQKVKSRRYLPSLRQIPQEKKLTLNEWLSEYKTLLLLARAWK